MAVRLLLGICLFIFLSPAYGKNLYELIKSEPSLSEMFAIIEADLYAKMTLERVSITAFMPNNDALEHFKGPTDMDFINAHLTKSPILIQSIEDTITSDYPGYPEIHITKIPNSKHNITGYENHDYYVNNAKVIRANLKAETGDKKMQILHIIDGVLAPTRPVNNAASAPAYPKAGDLLQKFRTYGLLAENPQNSIKLFTDRVQSLDQMKMYEEEGPNTYFVPIDSAIQSSSQVMDQKVIHGHIVQGQALVTRPAAVLKETVQSVAFYDNLKVLLKIEEVKSTNATAYYVESHTISSDSSHPKGTAMARIVKGNIPVANGVVHLIDRALMTTAESILAYLKEAGQLSKFYELFREHQPDLLQTLVSTRDLTLFAPSNYAFSRVMQSSLNETIPNSRKLEALLKLHMVPKRLSSDLIIRESATKEYSAATLSTNRKLYFSSHDDNPNKAATIYVQGAGVNSTVTTHDIIAQNGFIHIIDRILAIPSQTIFEKLQSSPLLSTTYKLVKQAGFEKDFSDRNQRFTMFVPDDEAWELIHKTMPSAFKKLNLGEFAYHVKQILQRHLIMNQTLSITAIRDLTLNSTPNPNNPKYHELSMMRGNIYFEPHLEKKLNDYVLYWQGIVSKVKQPDVECVNGVLHIINAVLMSPHDVTVSAASQLGAFLTPLPLLLLAFMLR